MFKFIICSLYLFLSLSQSFAKVEFRWLTVASLVLDDGETQIMFDPMFTRAGVGHWLGISKFKSDEALVQQVLKEQGLDRLEGVFSSHSHYDHVVDAPIVALQTGATFFVDQNSEIIARAYKNKDIKTQRFQNLEKIQIGKFSIRMILRKHSPIRLLHIDWLSGPVSKNFDFSFYDYHVGDTWFYLIEHPEGKILVDQGSEPYLKELKPYAEKVDVVIQGIANRSSDDAILEGYLNSLNPQVFIPIHFDNFFFGFKSAKEVSYLPGVRMDDIMEKVRGKFSKIDIREPKYGEKIEVLK